MGKDHRKAMVVIASGDRPLDEVAHDLKGAGFEVGQVLHAIGQVTGYGAPDLRDRLKRIRGVAEVSESHEDFQIGPPGAVSQGGDP